jgi:hypothetical protein
MISVRTLDLNIVFLLFTIIIISTFKSSHLTIFFFNNLKLALIAVVILLIIISLFKININRKLFFQILLLFFLVIYGILLNFLNVTDYDLQINKEQINFILSSFLLTYFLLKINNYKELNNYNHIIFYLFLVLSLIFFTLKGYDFDNYSYNFEEEIIYNKKISKISYSQGLTIIFFLASFTSLYLYKEVNIKKYPIMIFWYFAALIFFLFFAMQGGSRGETFFGLLILLYMLLSNIKKNFIKVSVLVFFFMIVLTGNINFEDYLVARRFEVFFDNNSDFGLRDVLINLSLNILYNEPKCLILGCGFSFFQDYYGFDYGMYPHNIILEFIISYGLPISIVIFSLVFFGLKNIIFLKSKILLIDIFVIYFFLISLKSGTLISLSTFPIIFYLIAKSKIKFNFKLN